MTSAIENNFPKRRILITDGKLSYKIFSFTQAMNDGSIYISSPNFSEIKWLAVSDNQGKLQLSVVDSPGDGKISIHASGISSIRSNKNQSSRELIVHGNYLLDLAKNQAGIRHLLTVLMSEPSKMPVTNRKNDYLLKSTKPFSPMVMIFFAIPRIADLKEIGIEGSFDIDNLEHFPGDIGGFGLIELVYHSIAWFIYKTKHMDIWPKVSSICYFDGFSVPIFIGVGEDKYRFEFLNPEYEVNEKKLTIKLAFSKTVDNRNLK